MGKKLYVGNLPFNATDEDLTSFFTQCGTVDSARIVSDRETGRSRGFGFVEMGTDEQAQDAISRLHGAQLEGRALTVNEARPQEPRRGGGGGGGFGGGGFGGGRSSGGPRRERY